MTAVQLTRAYEGKVTLRKGHIWFAGSFCAGWARSPASIQDLEGEGSSSGDTVDCSDMYFDLHPI